MSCILSNISKGSPHDHRNFAPPEAQATTRTTTTASTATAGTADGGEPQRQAMKTANRTGSPDKRLNGWLRREQRIRYLGQHPLCAECERQGRVTAATELDHVVPLGQGGVANAYDDTGLEGLCHACHAAKTRAELGQKPRGGCDESGMPSAPDHPWNK